MKMDNFGVALFQEIPTSLIDFEGWKVGRLEQTEQFSILFDSCLNISLGFPKTVACLLLFEVVQKIVQKRKRHVRIYSGFPSNWRPKSDIHSYSSMSQSDDSLLGLLAEASKSLGLRFLHVRCLCKQSQPLTAEYVPNSLFVIDS